MKNKIEPTIQAYLNWCEKENKQAKDGKSLKEYNEFLIPLKEKQQKILEILKVLCNELGIVQYDYKVGYNYEVLVVEGTEINCLFNSITCVIHSFLNGVCGVEEYD